MTKHVVKSLVGEYVSLKKRQHTFFLHVCCHRINPARLVNDGLKQTSCDDGQNMWGALDEGKRLRFLGPFQLCSKHLCYHILPKQSIQNAYILYMQLANKYPTLFFSLYPVPSVFCFFFGTNASHYKPSFPVSPALSGNNRLFLSARNPACRPRLFSFQYEGEGQASDNPQDMHSADNPYVHCGLTLRLGRKQGSVEQDVAAAFAGQRCKGRPPLLRNGTGTVGSTWG